VEVERGVVDRGHSLGIEFAVDLDFVVVLVFEEGLTGRWGWCAIRLRVAEKNVVANYRNDGGDQR